jgi:hypothetical protein
MKRLIILFSISIFLSGCLNQVKNENRIIQVFPFKSALYIEHGNKDESGTKEISGQILFEKEKIVITINSEPNNNVESCKIKTVTFDNNPNEIEYRTNKGTFHTTIRNDTITTVHWVNSDFSALFDREPETKKIKVKLPIVLEKQLSGWKRIKIIDIASIDLPPGMEIQGKNFKELTNKLKSIAKKEWDIEFAEPKMIFQPKGVNSSERESLSKYARVMYEITNGNAGDYQKLTEVLSMSTAELDELNIYLKNQFIEEFKKSPLRIIEWYPIQIIEVNGMSALYISYKRQLSDKPFVHVDTYKFFDYDKIHSLTLSYRISEKDLWKTKLDQSLKSFRIIKFN